MPRGTKVNNIYNLLWSFLVSEKLNKHEGPSTNALALGISRWSIWRPYNFAVTCFHRYNFTNLTSTWRRFPSKFRRSRFTVLSDRKFMSLLSESRKFPLQQSRLKYINSKYAYFTCSNDRGEFNFFLYEQSVHLWIIFPLNWNLTLCCLK